MSSSKDSLLKSGIAVILLVAVGIGAGVLLTARLHWTETSRADEASPPVNYQYASQGMAMAAEAGESPFVAVAERVSPTVVNITTDRKVGNDNSMEDFFRDSPFWEFFHRDMTPPKGKRNITIPASGSGIIIDGEGYILTNNHMVEDAEKITVKVQDGHEFKATVIGTDPETDLALIKVDHSFAPSSVALLGNSDNIKIGDWAIAMGNPLGLDWTLTVGVISAKGRTNLAIQGGGPSYQDFIQTDASINFGNSGGPLCNIHGEVIGVNTAINSSGQGIGFAIPISMASKVVDQLRNKGAVTRGYLGMLPRELTEDLRSALGVSAEEKGVFVERVDKNTPAESGGLQAGDVITAFDGKPVSDVTQFRLLVADHTPGSPVNAEILRDGKKQNLHFVLGDRTKLSSLMGKGQEPVDTSEKFLGIEVEEVTADVARALGLDDPSGVIVTDVDPDGPAAEKLRERDVIIEIDRQPVNNLADFKRIAAASKSKGKALLFRILRNGAKTFEAIEP